MPRCAGRQRLRRRAPRSVRPPRRPASARKAACASQRPHVVRVAGRLPLCMANDLLSGTGSLRTASSSRRCPPVAATPGRGPRGCRSPRRPGLRGRRHGARCRSSRPPRWSTDVPAARRARPLPPGPVALCFGAGLRFAQHTLRLVELRQLHQRLGQVRKDPQPIQRVGRQACRHASAGSRCRHVAPVHGAPPRRGSLSDARCPSARTASSIVPSSVR